MSSIQPVAVIAESFTRTRPAPATPEESLTDDQSTLDHRLREWRKAESEKLGLPQFFLLGTSALRSIVLARPQTLSALESINGVGQEKLDRFGTAILALCRQ